MAGVIKIGKDGLPDGVANEMRKLIWTNTLHWGKDDDEFVKEQRRAVYRRARINFLQNGKHEQTGIPLFWQEELKRFIRTWEEKDYSGKLKAGKLENPTSNKSNNAHTHNFSFSLYEDWKEKQYSIKKREAVDKIIEKKGIEQLSKEAIKIDFFKNNDFMQKAIKEKELFAVRLYVEGSKYLNFPTCDTWLKTTKLLDFDNWKKTYLR